MTKEYYYTNDFGIEKMIAIQPPEDGKYSFSIFEMTHGEWCGSGRMTCEELAKYFTHYGIDIADLDGQEIEQ